MLQCAACVWKSRFLSLGVQKRGGTMLFPGRDRVLPACMAPLLKIRCQRGTAETSRMVVFWLQGVCLVF